MRILSDTQVREISEEILAFLRSRVRAAGGSEREAVALLLCVADGYLKALAKTDPLGAGALAKSWLIAAQTGL